VLGGCCRNLRPGPRSGGSGPKRNKTEDADLLRTASASNFAKSLGGNRSPQEEKIAKRRDKKRKERVLADLANGKGETQRQVGQKHGISARWVRQIKHNAKKSQIEHVDWYRKRMDDALSSIGGLGPTNYLFDQPEGRSSQNHHS